jgi:hypothetical protein
LLASLRDNFEITLSFVVVVFLGVVYVVYALVSVPSGGHPFGHFLGILGSVLMVVTELAYSARKRSALFRFGQVRHWLSFHIFTGIVGPALVFWHTALEFRGLAGLATVLAGLVVASGFLGRYIYTAVPRTLAGAEVDRRQLEAEARRLQEELAAWSADKSAQVQALVRTESSLPAESAELSGWGVLLRRIDEWREERRLQGALQQLDRQERARVSEIERLLRRQHLLVRQIESLQTVRRLMGLWHTAHVPLGLTLFTAMVIHVVATIYFGALR